MATGLLLAALAWPALAYWRDFSPVLASLAPAALHAGRHNLALADRPASTGPTSTILTPSNGVLITQAAGSPLRVAGTAVATAGLERVEVSTNSGGLWATAVGTATWSYTWTLPAANHVVYTISARAVDKAGTVQQPPAIITVTLDNVEAVVHLPLVLKNATGDTYEPNNSRSGAYGPLASGTAYASYVWSANDTWDCYWFDPTGLGTVTITLTSIPAGTDYDLQLYDSATSSSPVKESRKFGNADEQIVYGLGHADKHYTCVYAYSGWSNADSYLLSATYP